MPGAAARPGFWIMFPKRCCPVREIPVINSLGRQSVQGWAGMGRHGQAWIAISRDERNAGVGLASAGSSRRSKRGLHILNNY
jgi:hypothetical protein